MFAITTSRTAWLLLLLPLLTAEFQAVSALPPPPQAPTAPGPVDPPTPSGTSSAASFVTAWEYRITAISPRPDAMIANRGVLEVRPNGTAPWDTVCDEGFTLAAASVACRSVGVPTPRSPTWFSPQMLSSHIPTSNATPRLTARNCTGNETSLAECITVLGANSSCTVQNQVFVDCNTWEGRLVGGTEWSGRVEIRSNSTAPWGTVCDAAPGAWDAFVACQTVFPNSTVVGAVTLKASQFEPAAPSMPIYFTHVECPGVDDLAKSRVSLAACASGAHVSGASCNHTTDIGVQCELDGRGTAERWQARLQNLGGGAGEGLVQIRPAALPAAGFGTICDRLGTMGFNETSAICRSLGYPGNFAYAVTGGFGTGPIYMDGLRCPAGGTLDDCDFTAATGCTHAQDVVVICGAQSPGVLLPDPVATSSVVVRGNDVLLLTKSDRGGRPLPPSNSGEWGLLCGAYDSAFSDLAAAAVCRRAYANDDTFIYAGVSVRNVVNISHSVLSPYSIYATSIDCPTALSSLSGCSIRNQTLERGRSSCHPVAFRCVTPETVPMWKASLDSNVLQIQYDAALAPAAVCGTGVNWNVALAAARQIASGRPSLLPVVPPIDVILSHTAAAEGYAAAVAQYDCGEVTDADAPSSLRACTVAPNSANLNCTVRATIEWEGVRWAFALGNEAKEGRYVVGTPRADMEAQYAIRQIGVSPGFTVSEATLEVICRSMGGNPSSFFRRRAIAIDVASTGYRILSPYMTDPQCDSADVPSLNRCRYRYTGDEAPSSVASVLAVECRVWPLWFLVVVPVFSGLVLIAITAAVVICCVRRRRLALRRSRHNFTVDEVNNEPHHAPAAGAVDVELSDEQDVNTASGRDVSAQRRRWQSIVRGEVPPTSDAFSFGFLGSISGNFSRTAYTPVDAVPSSEAAFFECVDIAGGVVVTSIASVSVVRIDAISRIRNSFLEAAQHARESAPGTACFPALYAIVVADVRADDLRAIARRTALPLPPVGCTYVAVLTEAPPSDWCASTVVTERVVKPPEMQRAAGFIARSANALAAWGLMASSHPASVCFRGGTADGAPFPSRVWFSMLTPSPAMVQAALERGLGALGHESGCTVLPRSTSNPLSLPETIEQLETQGDMAHTWQARPPFNTDAECPLRVQTTCIQCGALSTPVGSRIGALRCTATTGHFFCRECVVERIAALPPDQAQSTMPCASFGCTATWLPDDFRAVQRLSPVVLATVVPHAAVDPLRAAAMDDREDVEPIQRPSTGRVATHADYDDPCSVPDADRV
jgi:hypothetical protein